MEQPKRKNNSFLYSSIMMGIIVLYVFLTGNVTQSGSANSYVKPHHTRTGKLVKGHSRKSVSISPKAVKSQNYSKGYYYRHKYRKSNSKKK